MAQILIVDDEEVLRDLLSQILEGMGHECDLAENGEVGCRAVVSKEYDLIITDIRMPGMNGLEFLQAIRERVETRTPCIIITALADEPDVAVEAVGRATDFLSKPFQIREIQRAVDRALGLREAWKFRERYERRLEEKLREKEQELRRTYDGVLIGFAAMLEGKDGCQEGDDEEAKLLEGTWAHCRRLREICTVLAYEMGIRDDEEIRHIQLGAILHDIGKYRLPDALLWKKGPLTPEQWVEMRRHPEYGVQFVQSIPFLRGAIPVIQHHHERWDGSGYPGGIAADGIPVAARIFSVADAFDAIVSKRCYKDALPWEFALEELQRNSGSQFDPAVVEAFARVYPRLKELELDVVSSGACRKDPAAPEPGSVLDEVMTALRSQVAEETRLAVGR